MHRKRNCIVLISIISRMVVLKCWESIHQIVILKRKKSFGRVKLIFKRT